MWPFNRGWPLNSGSTVIKWVVTIDILYTLNSASNYSAIQKLKP
jgi:hypothetical protein